MAIDRRKLGVPFWRRGPLITPDANVAVHVGWRNGAIRVFSGPSWTTTGSPPQVGASGAVPPGAGPLDGGVLYTRAASTLNFAGDFTAAVVAKLTATTGSFALMLVTGNGSVGYFGSILQSSGVADFILYPSGDVRSSTAITIGQPFVLVFGRASGVNYVKLSGGTSTRSSFGTYTPGAVAGTIGSGLGGNAFPGVVYEVYATSTAYSDALASSAIAQAGSRMKRNLGWSPDSSSVTPGPVVALGDSITAGAGVTTPYPTTLVNTLGVPWTMTNGGVPSDRTDQVLVRWNSTYKGTGQKWVPILAGVNDAIQNVTTDGVTRNLLALYESAFKDGARVIPITITPWKNHASWTAGRQTVTDEVNAWIAWWSTTNGVPYVDAYNSALNDGAGALAAIYDQGDGIHPNQAGADYLAGLVRAVFP